MKPRQIIILFIIFLLVIALGLFKNIHRANLLKQTSNTRLNFKIDKNVIDRIELRKGDKTQVVIDKNKDVWQIPDKWNAVADSTLVQSLLDMVSNLTGELRGNNSDVFSDFEISDSSSFRIILSKDKKAVFELLLSPKIPENGGTFVRLGGTNSVYLTDSSLFALFGILGDPHSQDLKDDYWVDLSLFRLDPVKIDSLLYHRFSGGKENIVFQIERSGDNQWTLKNIADASKIDSAKILNYLQKISKENALQIMDPNANYGLDSPDGEIVIRLSDKSEERLAFKEAPKDAKDKGYYAKVSRREGVCLISPYTLQTLTPNSDFFMAQSK